MVVQSSVPLAAAMAAVAVSTCCKGICRGSCRAAVAPGTSAAALDAVSTGTLKAVPPCRTNICVSTCRDCGRVWWRLAALVQAGGLGVQLFNAATSLYDACCTGSCTDRVRGSMPLGGCPHYTAIHGRPCRCYSTVHTLAGCWEARACAFQAQRAGQIVKRVAHLFVGVPGQQSDHMEKEGHDRVEFRRQKAASHMRSSSWLRIVSRHIKNVSKRIKQMCRVSPLPPSHKAQPTCAIQCRTASVAGIHEGEMGTSMLAHSARHNVCHSVHVVLPRTAVYCCAVPHLKRYSRLARVSCCSSGSFTVNVVPLPSSLSM